MTDETTPEAPPERLPRIEGLSIEVASRVLSELDEEVERFVGELDYRYAAGYTSRAHMRFALGFTPVEVLDDLWMGARCLAANPGMHLMRHASEQLLTRRITPVELGLLSGQLDLSKRLAGAYGLPLSVGRAGLADQTLETELRILSPGLLGEKMTHPQHLLGLAASVYAGALSASARGFADEAELAIRMLAAAEFDGDLEPRHKAVMFRYSGLCEAIVELLQPGMRHFEAILADQIQRYTAQMRQMLGDAYLVPTAPQRYMDTSSMAVMALGLMAQYPVGEFPPDPKETPLAQPYTELLAAMVAGPQKKSPSGEETQREEDP